MSKRKDTQSELTRKELFKILRKQLSTRKIINYDEIPTSHLFKPHLETVNDLILRTITTGVSDSLIIAGPRGSGKTTLLNSALRSLEDRKNKVQNRFSIVELNGLIHTDDNVALKDIARQLNLTNVVEEKVTGTFAENMSLILETLKSGGDNNNHSLIFYVEEFDLFSHHKNQTLLYNLFDSAQNAGTPILILGVTCRLDVVELLEKRVKSRFSHRQLYLFDNLTFDNYIDTAKYWLSLGNNVPDSSLKTKWNQFINYKFFEDENTRLMVKRSYDFSPNFSSLQKLLWPIIGQLSFALKTTLENNSEDIVIPEYILKPILKDSKQLLIQSLSILELTLVVVMLRHATIYEGEPFNLRTIYEQYEKLVRSDKNEGLAGMREFPKAVVSKAFENMEQLELIRPADNSSLLTSYKGQKDYRSMTLLLQPSQLKEALENYPSLPAQLHQFASNSF